MSRDAPKGKPISVRLFSSHPVVRDSLSALFDREPGICAATDNDLCQVGVVDGKVECLETGLTVLRLRFPHMKLILLWRAADKNEGVRWLMRGISGLVDYGTYQEDLAAAVRAVAQGDYWSSPSVLRLWKKLEPQLKRSGNVPHLTRREGQVMALLARRLSDQAIANILGMRPKTVKVHVSDILKKLDVDSRREVAAEWAFEGATSLE